MGYAIAQRKRWDLISQINKENLGSSFRSNKSPTGRSVSLMAGMEKAFKEMPTDEFMKAWYKGDYPTELVDFMDQEYQRRLDSGRASLGPGVEHGVPGSAYPGGLNPALTDPNQLNDTDLSNELPRLFRQVGMR